MVVVCACVCVCIAVVVVPQQLDVVAACWHGAGVGKSEQEGKEEGRRREDCCRPLVGEERH